MTLCTFKAFASVIVALTLGVRGIAQPSGDRAAVEKLLETLRTGNEAAKRQAIEEIGADDVKIRISAMKAWRRLAEQHDEDVLKKQPKLRAMVVDRAVSNLTAENPRQRLHAADLFRTLVPDEAEKIIPVLVRLIKERAIPCRDVGHMLSGQGEYGTVHDDLRNRALPALVSVFADASPELHAELVEFLAGRHYRFNVEWLPDALADKHANIRAGAAATARRSLSDKKIVQGLRGLLKDPELPVRFHAAAALCVRDRDGASQGNFASAGSGPGKGPAAGVV